MVRPGTLKVWCALALLVGCSDASNPPSPDGHGSSTLFDVTGATSTGSISVTVFFDAPPDASSAATAGNYTIAGLAVTSAPVVSDEVVTLETGPQLAITYTVTVAGVTRGSDGASLSTRTATFVGRSSLQR